MGKLAILFTAGTVACIFGYLSIWALIMSNPTTMVWLSFLLMPFGWGIILLGVGAVVCWILKK